MAGDVKDGAAGPGIFAGPVVECLKHTFAGPDWAAETYMSAGGGELQASFRPLLKRMVRSWVFEPIVADTPLASGAQILPLPNFVVWPQLVATAGNYVFYVTPLSVLASCFARWRGTQRHMVQTLPLNSSATYSLTGYVMRTPLVAGGLAPGAPRRFVAAKYTYAAFNPLLGDAGIDAVQGDGVSVFKPLVFDLPYQGVNWTRMPASIGALDVEAQLVQHGYAGDTTQLTFLGTVASGDDLQFYGWTGMPRLAAQTLPNTLTGWVAM